MGIWWFRIITFVAQFKLLCHSESLCGGDKDLTEPPRVSLGLFSLILRTLEACFSVKHEKALLEENPISGFLFEEHYEEKEHTTPGRHSFQRQRDTHTHTPDTTKHSSKNKDRDREPLFSTVPIPVPVAVPLKRV